MARADGPDDEEEGLVRPSKDGAAEKPSSYFSLQAMRRTFADETFRCGMATMIAVITLGACVLCYMLCPLCLLILVPAFLILSCYHSYHIVPMLLSSLLLIFWFLYHGLTLSVTPRVNT